MDNKLILKNLTKSIDDVFKILPLYEDKNDYLPVYIDSLIFKLRGIEIDDSECSEEYASMLIILNSLRIEINNLKFDNQLTIKREVFKSINMIKKIISKLEVL